MGRSNGQEKMELKKGPWTREEDQKLLAYIEENGRGSWRTLPAKAGLQRCGKSCRLRWTNYLRPDIKRGKFSTQEEKAIIRLHALLGNRWSAIATHLPKRTDNEIKNYWNTRLKKRLTRMGLDPVTHKPKENPNGSSRHAAALVSHMAQWETARLEAEARLVREAQIHSRLQLRQRISTLSPPFAWRGMTAGGLESPTSTLNFTGDCVRVSKAIEENGHMQIEGEMVNSSHAVCDDTFSVDYTPHNVNLPAEIDKPISEGFEYSPTVNDGEFEDSKNYWSELFNLVSSPLGVDCVLNNNNNTSKNVFSTL